MLVNVNRLRLIPSGIIFLLTLFNLQNVQAQSVRTHVSTDSVSVGDLFNYLLVIQLDEQYNRVIFPDTAAFPPSLELNDRQQFKLTQFSDSITYHLQFFGDEDVTIPPMPVILYSDEDTTIITTEPVTLFFRSLVEEGDSSLQPMKPIFDFPHAWWPWILAALIIAAFLVWWFKYRQVPEKPEPKPVQKAKPFYNPLKELEKTLHHIKRDLKVEQTRDFKTYYSAIGDAIRRYYEDLYKIPALESTTRELLRYLDAYGADQEMLDTTRKVLRQADLVKFAKFTPTLDDAHRTFQYAMDFLDRARVADAARISHLKAQYNAQFSEAEPNVEEA